MAADNLSQVVTLYPSPDKKRCDQCLKRFFDHWIPNFQNSDNRFLENRYYASFGCRCNVKIKSPMPYVL